MLTSAIAKQPHAANVASAAKVAKYTAILMSKRRSVVPIPGFDRWRWTHHPEGSLDLP